MQLHRNNTSNLIDFSSEMQKIARSSAKELFLKDREQQAFDALKASADPYSGAKAFSKGFGVSFAVPLALGLSSLKPQELASKMTQVTNTFIVSEQMKKGLMEGGVSAREANKMTPYLVKRFQANQNLPILVNPMDNTKFSNIGIEVKRAVKNSLKKDIVEGTSTLIPAGAKWSGADVVPRIEAMPVNSRSYNILRRALGEDVAKMQLESTVDDIYKKMTFKAPQETALTTLVQSGEAALKRDGKDIIPAARTQARKVLINVMKGPAKVGLGLGVLGGISAAISNMKSKKRYLQYKNKARGMK